LETEKDYPYEERDTACKHLNKSVKFEL